VVVQDKKTKDAPQSVISATQSDWQSIVAEIKAILGKGSIVSNNHKLGSNLLMDCALQALINPTTCLNLMQ
jgi:hypothetical protein